MAGRALCQLHSLPIVALRHTTRHPTLCCSHNPASVAPGASGTAATAATAAAAAAPPAPSNPSVEAAASEAAPSDPSEGAAANGSDDDDVPLGTADLRHFIEQRGIAAQIVPSLVSGGAAPPAGSVEVKSLVFLVELQPIVSVTTDRR